MPDASLEAWSRRQALLSLAAFGLGFALGRPEALAVAGLVSAFVALASRRARPDRAVEARSGLRLGIAVTLGLTVDVAARWMSASALLASLALRAVRLPSSVGRRAFRRDADVLGADAPERRAVPARGSAGFEQATDAFSMLVGALALEHRVAPGPWVSLPGVLACLLALARVPVPGVLVNGVLLALAAGFASDHPGARAVLLLGVAIASLFFALALFRRAFARLRSVD